MEEQKAWVRDYLAPRYPELVAPYCEAESIAMAATRSGVLSTVELDVLVKHARSRRTPLGENVASMIGHLAGQIPEARNAILALATDPHVHVRVNALVALSSFERSALHEQVLAAALMDKSFRVRELTASKIMGFGLRNLIPSLEHAIARERDVGRGAALRWYMDLLRDGYLVKEERGGFAVTCRTDDGVISTSFAEEEMETKGRAWIRVHARVAT